MTAVQEFTGQIRLMNETGDTAVLWDRAVPEQVDEARKVFTEARSQGLAAYSTNATTKQSEVIREFDPDATMVVLIPQLQGG
jgi:hypothetical protein